jgi:hypothetical protein
MMHVSQYVSSSGYPSYTAAARALGQDEFRVALPQPRFDSEVGPRPRAAAGN